MSDVLFAGVDLVDDQEDSLAGPSQEPGKFLVGSGDGSAAVDDEEDERRMIDCNLRLFEDLSRDLGFLAGNDAAGVDNLEGSPVPSSRAIDAIAGDAGLIGNDRSALADEAVEERRLANIGPADDGDQRKCGRHSVNFAFLLEDSTSELNKRIHCVIDAGKETLLFCF